MAAPGKSSPTVASDASAATQLLMDVARRAAGPSRDKVVATPGIDWEVLLHLAALHGLHAFLLQEIRHSEILVPPEIVNRLSSDTAELAARNLTLGRETLAVCSLLQRRGIPHLVYKGPLLGEFLYRSQCLRSSHDIDLIVAPPHAKDALDTLKQSGYIDPLRLKAGQTHAAVRYGSEYSLVKGGIEVDLHWRPAPAVLSRSLDLDGLWTRAKTGRLFNSQLPTLAAEDLFVLLCLHAGEHGWAHLSLFTDLARLLIVVREFDWEIVRAHLRDENVRRAIDVTLLLLATQFGASVPSAMLRREAQVEIIAANVIGRFWPNPEAASHMETSLRWVIQRCRGESLSARLQWIWGCTMNPTLADFRRFSLPAGLSLLYPPLRILRLALRTDRRHEVIGTRT